MKKKQKKYVDVELRVPNSTLEKLDAMIARGWFEDRQDAVVFIVRAELIRMELSKPDPK